MNMPVLAIKYHSISDYAMFQSYYVRISGQNLRDFNFEFPHTSDNASHLRILVTGFFFQIKISTSIIRDCVILVMYGL